MGSNPQPQATTPPDNAIVRYFKDFAVLRETRREYWGIQIINVIDCAILFAIVTMGSQLLSQNFGFSDAAAGNTMALYGSGITICLFFFGAVTDKLGIRPSFYVSEAGLFVTRAALMLLWFFPALLPPTMRFWAIVVLFGLMAPFMAMVQTVFQAATRRFTTARSRSAGFNAWYIFMNVGAAISGWLIDFIRIDLKTWYHYDVPPNVLIMDFGAVGSVLCILCTAFFVRSEEQLYGPDETPSRNPAGGAADARGLWERSIEVIKEPVFLRFLVLVALLLGVRAVFLHSALLMPKFWERVIGPDARIGKLEMINPIGVMVGLVVLIPILKRYTVYGMLAWGSLISAISLFLFVIPLHGAPVYYTSALSMVLLTVGEVIWSPRLTEYTAAIAPEGQEGTYLGLSMVPYFFAKTVVSLLSGYMLSYWVPEQINGTPLLEHLQAGTIPFWKSPAMMWLILSIWALSGPIAALAMKNWFTRGAKWEKEAAQSH